MDQDFSLQKAISNIEGKLADGSYQGDEDDDVLPAAAADMGSGEQHGWCVVMSLSTQNNTPCRVMASGSLGGVMDSRMMYGCVAMTGV